MTKQDLRIVYLGTPEFAVASLLVGGPDAAADLKAVHVARHHNVQDGHARVGIGGDGVQRLLTVPGLDHVIASKYHSSPAWIKCIPYSS